VTSIFSIVIETAKLDYFFCVLCDKIKGHLIQHCCGTLRAREMFQEVRIVVYDYHDSKSVRYSSIFLTHCIKNAKGGTVWQLHKDQCQYAVSYTRRQTSSSAIL